MAIPQDHVKALDQLRVRLSSLVISLENLQKNLHINDPLPTWPELQANASALGSTMQELSDALNSQRQLFSSMHAYPTSTFPAYDPQRQNLLYALLWKKLDPPAEAWIEKALQDNPGQNDIAQQAHLAPDQIEELWSWAGTSSGGFVKKLLEDGVFADDYTLAERESGVENVVTGLKRDLDEDEDDDEKDEEDKMEEDNKPESTLGPQPSGFDPARPAMSLESLLRFASGADLNPPGPKR